MQDILKKCEQNVSDHRLYMAKQSDCAQWLIRAKEKFGANADTTGTRVELEEKLEQIQVIIFLLSENIENMLDFLKEFSPLLQDTFDRGIWNAS